MRNTFRLNWYIKWKQTFSIVYSNKHRMKWAIKILEKFRLGTAVQIYVFTDIFYSPAKTND